MLFDDILKQLGEFGPYQRRVYLLATLYYIPWAFHAIASVFLAAGTDHWCSIPTPVSDAFNCTGFGLDLEECERAQKNLIIPRRHVEGALVYEQCERYNISGFTGDATAKLKTNVTQECDTWEYDMTQYKTTVVQDFDLVCENKNLPKYADSAYFAGFLIGNFLFGNIADWIGRYLTFFIAVGCMTVSGTVAAFSPTFTAYAIMKFFIGLTNMAGLCAFTLGSEIVGPSKRAMAGNVGGLLFSVGYMLLAIIAYFIRDWRQLQLAISVPLVLFFLLIPILCESPRWLISRGQFSKAEQIIRKAAKVNKAQLPKVLFEEHEQIMEKEDKAIGTPWDLFKTPNMRAKSLNLFYNWFVNNMVYYGLSLSTSGLGVNDYVAAFVSGAVEVPALLSCWFILDRFGRRFPLFIYMVGGGMACILAALLPPGVGRTVVAMIGKFGITASFSVAYILSGELFPTPVRSIGIGMSSMCARVSGIIAPFILILGDYWPPLPFIIFGVNSVVAGALALLLPETLGTNLPQTLHEGEAFTRSSSNAPGLWTLCKFNGKDTEYQKTPAVEDAKELDEYPDDINENSAVPV
ncbi:organic cation transporter protein-like [Amphiura filiformis]|uniref:organic cation transporter protein-like n=1 Tax=Amphiura filiformis TaxID=82378 RepID=UPI003B21A917